ncbi:hypothetical protein [Bacillus infantis]|nr:hypothetical protein [Bacillus infantis]
MAKVRISSEDGLNAASLAILDGLEQQQRNYISKNEIFLQN